MAEVPADCGNDITTVNVETETLAARTGTDCAGDPTVEQGNPVVPVGVTTVGYCPTQTWTTKMERLVGAGSIVVPATAISFSVTVVEGERRSTNIADQPTVDGPNFTAPVALPRGFSHTFSVVSRKDDDLDAVHTITGKASGVVSDVIVSWIEP